MKKELLIKAIYIAIDGLFQIQPDEGFSKKLEEIKPRELTDVATLRIQRLPNSEITMLSFDTWRTVLVTVLANKDQVRHALRWAALVKDVLLDPESSDLYLFIAFENQADLTIESCIHLESTEQFCRKYVLRPEETPEQLVERTFLAPLISSSMNTRVSDPLIAAFSNTGSQHTWFNTAEQNRWQKIFLSGKKGDELVDELFRKRSENS